MCRALTDWYMGWQTLKALNIDPKTVQVVLLDAHPAGRSTPSGITSCRAGNRCPRRVAQLEKPIRVRRPVWSPPGYTNILLGKELGRLPQPCA